jgi:hypothetical protein
MTGFQMTTHKTAVSTWLRFLVPWPGMKQRPQDYHRDHDPDPDRKRQHDLVSLHRGLEGNLHPRPHGLVAFVPVLGEVR